MAALDSSKSQVTNALSTLQALTQGEKKKTRQEVFIEWIAIRLPDNDPTGKFLTYQKKREISHFCYTNLNALRLNCRGISVEDELSVIRSQNPSRRPRDSDAIDLFHATLGLAYCNYFVTRDGFVRECSIYVKRELKMLNISEICEDLEGLSAKIRSLINNS
jgi:hypothetical protein